jgi:pyrroloquinoline-quinone synthase
MQVHPLEDQLSDILERWNLLRHPFYTAWLAGTLDRRDLAYYAIQYRHIVAALPGWLETTSTYFPARQQELNQHAQEEAQHVELWTEFSEALGVSRGQSETTPPNSATRSLLRQCEEAAQSGNGAAAVWALEAQSPAVSAEKLRGLVAHYGIDAKSGGQYFALHAELDIEHERQLRDLMKSQAPPKRDPTLVANEISAGLWELLSSMSG